VNLLNLTSRDAMSRELGLILIVEEERRHVNQ